MRSFVFSILVFSAATLFAAPMARVIDVKDARTLIVDRGGIAREVKLGDVVIAPGDDAAAIGYLRSTLVERYVMLESGAHGESYVYRSPDALFINGELSRRAYLNQGTKMTILGESSPGPERATRSAPARDTNRVSPPPKPRSGRRRRK